MIQPTISGRRNSNEHFAKISYRNDSDQPLRHQMVNYLRIHLLAHSQSNEIIHIKQKPGSMAIYAHCCTQKPLRVRNKMPLQEVHVRQRNDRRFKSSKSGAYPKDLHCVYAQRYCVSVMLAGIVVPMQNMHKKAFLESARDNRQLSQKYVVAEGHLLTLLVCSCANIRCLTHFHSARGVESKAAGT